MVLSTARKKDGNMITSTGEEKAFDKIEFLFAVQNLWETRTRKGTSYLYTKSVKSCSVGGAKNLSATIRKKTGMPHCNTRSSYCMRIKKIR